MINALTYDELLETLRVGTSRPAADDEEREERAIDPVGHFAAEQRAG